MEVVISSPSSASRVSPGRPPATSHAAIEAAAFRLFAERGFDETTTDEIAEEANIGRRTLFRYFPSKFDIPWGQFDDSLDYFQQTLESMPHPMPISQAVQESVVAFNTFDESAIPQHRARMDLILNTPSLQAHSVLMYEKWRAVIADYVADRLHLKPADLIPRTAGHVSLALAISAYEQWLRTTKVPLDRLLTDAMTSLRTFLDD